MDTITRDIMTDNKYSRDIKCEYLTMMNRMDFIKKEIIQNYRSGNHIILFNRLNEEIIYLEGRKKYFNKILEGNMNIIIQSYLDDRIDIYIKLIKNIKKR